MRKTLWLGVVSLALALGVPATASAHHLQQDTSSIVCVLVNNKPTIQVSAHFVDFSRWDQPVYRTVKINGVLVFGGDIPVWSGPDYTDSLSFERPPGTYDVVYQASWNDGDNGGYLKRTVTCPAPVPPPPPPIIGCNGQPVPPGTPMPTCPTVVIVCNGQTMPPGTTSCPAPPAPCVCPAPPPLTRCIPRRDIVFHTVRGSQNWMGNVKLYVRGRLVAVRHGRYRVKHVRFRDVYLGPVGRRAYVKIVAFLAKKHADGTLYAHKEFRVSNFDRPCGPTIRRDP